MRAAQLQFADLSRRTGFQCLELDHAGLCRLELAARTRRLRLRPAATIADLPELGGDPLEGLSDLRGTGTDRACGVAQLADRRELTRDLLVAALELGGVREVLGGGVDAHDAILAGDASFAS